jgi:hypothetical protein
LLGEIVCVGLAVVFGLGLGLGHSTRRFLGVAVGVNGGLRAGFERGGLPFSLGDGFSGFLVGVFRVALGAAPALGYTLLGVAMGRLSVEENGENDWQIMYPWVPLWRSPG